MAAEYLLVPKNRTLSVEDAYYCVLHRVVAERFEEAVKDALFFVGAAFHRKYKEVLLYLNDRYTYVLMDAILDALNASLAHKMGCGTASRFGVPEGGR